MKCINDIKDEEIVVLDFETTGLSPPRHRVIEVGAVIIRDGQLIRTFSTLCNPGKKISSFITKFTGISNEMVHDKPSPEDVMHDLFEFIGERPIIAHNASFDSKFLKAEMQRIDKDVKSIFICSLLLSRRLLKEAKNHKLSTLQSFIKFQATTNHQAHRALDDVLVTVALWNHIQTVVREKSKCSNLHIHHYQDLCKVPKSKIDDYFRNLENGSTMSTKTNILAQFNIFSKRKRNPDEETSTETDDSSPQKR